VIVLLIAKDPIGIKAVRPAMVDFVLIDTALLFFVFAFTDPF
jgi:hypothetical protein